MSGESPGPGVPTVTVSPHEVRPITDEEFERFRRFIYEQAGIAMSPQKRHLVAGRLHKRLQAQGIRTYGEYYRRVLADPDGRERQLLIDLLTTNETYFFREPEHFALLQQQILPRYRGRRLRLWSAACSSGEEVYSLAMVCAEVLGDGDWEVHGSDISQRMLEAARQGVYPLDRARHLPTELLRRYCLKGVRSHAGQLRVSEELRARTRFSAVNLQQPLRLDTRYPVIFLRNVLIYFDPPTKQGVVQRIARALAPGGHLFVSHVESLHGVDSPLRMQQPSVFQLPERSP